VRRRRVVAGIALIAVLAAAAVPGSVGSQGPSPVRPLDADLFREVEPASSRGTAATTPTLDPAHLSAGALSQSSVVIDRVDPPIEIGRPDAAALQPAGPLKVTIVRPKPKPKPTPRPAPVAVPRTTTGSTAGWRRDSEVSWYGPGFYGNRTACGFALTTSLQGVAHRSLPCGTRITFRNPANGRTVTTRVVDRGPYVPGRQWDITGGLCVALDHCYTGPLLWRFG